MLKTMSRVSRRVETVIMHKESGLYSVSSIGMLPFIEGCLRDDTSGLVASSRDSEEHA